MTSQPASQEEYAARKTRTVTDECDDAAGELEAGARYAKDLQTGLTALRDAATDDGVRGELSRLLRLSGIVTAQIDHARGRVSAVRARASKQA